MLRQATTALLLVTSVSVCYADRMSELVFPFPSSRIFSHFYNEVDNELVIKIKDVLPNELKSIDHYDERLIKRIVVREHDQNSVEVSLYLKDRNVRATVTSFQEPFRIAVYLFDRNYRIDRDPITGIPLARSKSAVSSVPNDTPAKYRLAQPSEQSVTQNPEPPQGSRRLLQPRPNIYQKPNELIAELEKVQPGVGKYWSRYPIYVYRLQTASHNHSQRNNNWHKNNASKALTSAEAMANYAGKLFDFGHENRSLLAYQQVLHKDARIFEKNALHLWKFAEAHLGQGNLTLADGYYQSLLEKHPENQLARFASLRRLDIEAIRATRQSMKSKFKTIAAKLSKIPFAKSSEFNAQHSIRNAYWSAYPGLASASSISDAGYMPNLNADLSNSLRNALPDTEGQKTAFLSASLMLHTKLAKDRPWAKETGTFAAAYFKRFSGKATEPLRTILQNQLSAKLNKNLQDKTNKGMLIEVRNDYESLAASLKTVTEDPRTAWALGETYRRLGDTNKSVKFYDGAAKSSPDGIDQFKALFWLAYTAAVTRQDLRAINQNPARVTYLGKKAREADQQLEASWRRLSPDDKNKVLVGMKIPLENTLTDGLSLKTPPRIILQSWQQALNTKASTATGNAGDIKDKYSPSANTVVTLSLLAKRFNELQLPKERRQALRLLKKIKPKDLGDENEAKSLWVSELLSLAEEYRTESQYLEAGRTYALAGKEGESAADRAASLYKGGLLLYRAGRREEAIEAFTACSEDGNNKYYADMCSDRLEFMNN